MLPVPVTVLTGFLGSGKTTLLQQLLACKAGKRLAVLINEFGEISIDHLLVKNVSGNTVVLQNGCICCSVRSDLRAGLRDLLDARSRGTVPPFDRIVIETTGLADPVPVVQTLVADPMLRHQVRLANLVSTVDGQNGGAQLGNFVEAMRQAATADHLVITKTDLCTKNTIDRLQHTLRIVNPLASIMRMPGRRDFSQVLFGRAACDDKEPRSWFGTAEAVPAGQSRSGEHETSIRSFVFRTSRQIDWTAFAVWLSLLVHRHGGQILRVKGLLDVLGMHGPVSLNAVQRFIHPPVHLNAWPDEDHSSRLVFIVQDLDETVIRDSLTLFLQRASETAATRSWRPDAQSTPDSLHREIFE